MNKKLMSIVISISIMFAFFSIAASADLGSIDNTSQSYYVSAANGSDSNDGSKLHPYKTIAAARNKAKGGDTVYIDSGVYTEPMIFWQPDSTKDASYNIVGLSDDVYLSAYSPVSAKWHNYGNDIYYADVGVYDDIPHILWYKDGGFNNMLEARWPNADADDVLNMDRAIMDEGSNNNYLYDNDLPQGDLNGATVYAWTGAVWDQYVAFARTITEYKSGESLKFDRIIPDEYNTENIYKPQKGDWYYLVNSLSLLDVAREYYYDREIGRLYVMLPDKSAPEDNEIWIQTESRGIELWSSSYVNISNINVLGGGVKIDYDSDHITLDNVNVYYSNWFRDSDGYATMNKSYNNTHICGNYVDWRNSEIAYTMSTGILIIGSNNTVENCNIHDVNITGGYNSAITFEPGAANNTVRKCDLSRSGRFLIYFAYSDQNNTGYGNTLIEYNNIYDCMYLTQDGGAIYTYHRNGNGVTIRNNWVHDTMRSGARGIYLDNNSRNFKVYRNVVWNIQEAGIVLNTDSINNLVCNNTVFGCGEGIQVWPKNPDSSMLGTRIINNILPIKADTIEGELAPEKLNNIYTDSPELDDGFVPISGSDIIDGGVSVDEITDGFVGSAPDVGAYEYGGNYWVPGTVNTNVPTTTNQATIEPTTAMPTTTVALTTSVPTTIVVSTTTVPTTTTVPSTAAPTATTAPTTTAMPNITEPTTIISSTVYGDLNGDNKVTLLDLIALRKYLAKWNVDVDLTAADCNGDGKVNLLDLILMRKYLAKWDVKLGPQE